MPDTPRASAPQPFSSPNQVTDALHDRGMCGSVNDDASRACILPIGHAGVCGWEAREPVAEAELRDFARSVSGYMATRTTPWPNEDAMHEAVAEAVRLIFTDAFHQTWGIAQVQARWRWPDGLTD